MQNQKIGRRNEGGGFEKIRKHLFPSVLSYTVINTNTKLLKIHNGLIIACHVKDQLFCVYFFYCVSRFNLDLSENLSFERIKLI